MCGRFSQLVTRRELVEQMGLADLSGSPADLRSRHNLAPGQDAVVVRMGAKSRETARLRWGLIPSWAEDAAIANRLINARVETAAERPAFRRAWRVRRCLIPASGWFEWTGAGDIRQPWLIRRRDGAPLFLAGLWERWRIPEKEAPRGGLAGRAHGDRVETFTILTTQANGDVEDIHHRMPVLMGPDQTETWLKGAPPTPPPAAQPGQLEALAVSTRVNDPRNDDPECLLPRSGLIPNGRPAGDGAGECLKQTSLF